MSEFYNRNSIFRLIYGIIFCAAAGVNSLAQTSEKQVTARESFDLNIVRERITETDFVRSTDVRLSDENNNGIKLEVGVGVRAEQINVLLRGITGRVNFRASLESIKQRIEQRRQNSLPN